MIDIHRRRGSWFKSISTSSRRRNLHGASRVVLLPPILGVKVGKHVCCQLFSSALRHQRPLIIQPIHWRQCSRGRRIFIIGYQGAMYRLTQQGGVVVIPRIARLIMCFAHSVKSALGLFGTSRNLASHRSSPMTLANPLRLDDARTSRGFANTAIHLGRGRFRYLGWWVRQGRS